MNTEFLFAWLSFAWLFVTSCNGQTHDKPSIEDTSHLTRFDGILHTRATLLEEELNYRGKVAAMEVTIKNFDMVTTMQPENMSSTNQTITIDIKHMPIKAILISRNPADDYAAKHEYVFDSLNATLTDVYYEQEINKPWEHKYKIIKKLSKDAKGRLYNLKELTVYAGTRDTQSVDRDYGFGYYNGKDELIKKVSNVMESEYKYNEYGDITQWLGVVKNDPRPSKHVFEYKYDDKGNWIWKKETTVYPNKSTKMSEITERKLKYAL